MKIQEIQEIDTIKAFVKGVYLLFDKDKKLLYIGQSVNVRSRIRIHISEKSKRQSDCEDNENYYHTKIPFGNVFYFSILNVENNELRNHTEQALIFMLKPKLNDLVRVGEKSKRLY